MNHRRDEGRNASHFLNRSAELTDREIDREKKFGWKRGEYVFRNVMDAIRVGKRELHTVFHCLDYISNR